MRRSLISLLVIVAVSGLILIAASKTKYWPSPTAQRSTGDVVMSNNWFAFDLYDALRAHGATQMEGGNVCFSPHSIYWALAAMQAGARGKTKEQLTETLHLETTDEALHESFGSLQRQLRGDTAHSAYELHIANAMWAQEDCRFVPEFEDLICDTYGGQTNRVDFRGKPRQACADINAWVESQTKGRIKNLIDAGAIDPLTRLVLTNAIYFKGTWLHPFSVRLTHPRSFQVTRRSQVDVAMMYGTFGCGYYASRVLQAVQLPYTGDAISMVVLLPRDTYGLRSLEKWLTCERFDEIIAGLDRQIVEVYLPKFKFSFGADLSHALKALGTERAFESDRADFSGIDDEEPLFVSGVYHKAFVEVNEQGTEAAAATALVAPLSMERPTYPVFEADHPFLFFIRDTRSGCLLFMGKVSNPNTVSGA